MGVVNLIYLPAAYQNDGIIYLLTNYLWWFIIVATAFIKIKSLIGGNKGSNPKADDDYVFIGEERVQELILKVNQIGVYLTEKLKLTTNLESNSSSVIQFVVSLYVLAVLG